MQDRECLSPGRDGSRIAQHVSAGLRSGGHRKVPSGTTESQVSVVPIGTHLNGTPDPALKCWANFGCPLRDKHRAVRLECENVAKLSSHQSSRCSQHHSARFSGYGDYGRDCCYAAKPSRRTIARRQHRKDHPSARARWEWADVVSSSVLCGADGRRADGVDDIADDCGVGFLWAGALDGDSGFGADVD